MSSLFKPPDKDTLGKKYDERYPLYTQLVEEVEYILSKGIGKRRIRISAIEHRVKHFAGFYDKIVRKEIAGNPFESIEDIAGVRIICLYRSDLEKIERLITEKFDVVESETLRRPTRTPFGYMSDHYVVRLPKSFRGERYDAIKSLKCEIQVRTVSTHAWATVSHHLDYKQETDIPSDLKDDFYALSGVFYIADSPFEQFRTARRETMKTLMEGVKKDQFSLEQEVNLDSLSAYLSWKFPHRGKGDLSTYSSAVSNLIAEMKKAGISSFQELDEKLDKNMDWFANYEKKNKYPGFFTDVGVARVILGERSVS